MTHHIDELGQAWKLAPALATRKPTTGTIHQTLLIETASGNYVLRTYRYPCEERWRVEAEHALIAYACLQKLPAIAPLPLPNGETILVHEGRIHALFPFAPGYQARRGHLTTGEIVALGTFLAQMHLALHDYPQDKTALRFFSIDHQATLAKIAEIEATILARPEPDHLDLHVVDRLRQRKAWLETTQLPDEAAFEQLEQQVIHGDYQETNLFFMNDAVSAVIDWDQAYPAPRPWEVIRALHYVFGFDPAPCHLFLEAYRQVMPLYSEELDIAAEVYSWIRTHDMWLYQEYYLQGNQRVYQFFSEKDFTPLIERWKALQYALKAQFS
jgi:Ser/Thr protein kinase RdoA (MazF antagonist)